MKTIVLLSQTEIINKIFTLISNKLMLHLKIYHTIDKIEQGADLIIIDDHFITEDISKLRLLSNGLILLKNDKVVEDRFDFIIEKPFLPSSLSITLEEILKNIEEIRFHEEKIYESEEPTIEELNDDLAKFIDSLLLEMDEKPSTNDDLIVKKEHLGHGGILDKDELSKLYEMISDEKGDEYSDDFQKDDNWIELINIIDKLNDDSTISKENKPPIELILNQYSAEELTPLFKQLNQNIIDDLTEGKEILLQLRLKI